MSKQDEEIIYLLDQCHLELGNAKIGPESATILGKYAERIERHYAGHNMATNSSDDNNRPSEPPSSLHTKLQTILKDLQPYDSRNADAVAQILQAFQEAKYARVERIPYRDRDGAKYTQYTITYPDGSGEFVRLPEYEILSPQAYYDRFKTELGDHIENTELLTDPRIREIFDNLHSQYLEAAKRAAGIA